MAGHATVRVGPQAPTAVPRGTAADPAPWRRRYVRRAFAIDGACALVAGLAALAFRFHNPGSVPPPHVILTVSLPLLWWVSVALARGYDVRFIGLGSDEFRRILNAAMSLTAGIAIVSYAARSDIARGYLLIALPCATVLDLVARLLLRKRLHRQRRAGAFMHRTIAVGSADAVADLITELRRETHHGLSVVGACLTAAASPAEVAGVPVCGGLGRIQAAVSDLAADTVAVLASPQLNGVRLRQLAWQLEETGTDLCVAPAVMDVAGPRISIRPVAGLPLLHVDHPELAGARQVIKGTFDKVVALTALIMLAPLMAGIALAVRLCDGGPALFRQTRVGRDERHFTVYKFRTMVSDAEGQKSALLVQNEGNGLLFKIRDDPRITPVGAWLRRYSLDELPQLLNVLKGDMSLVGPGRRCPRRLPATTTTCAADWRSSRV